MFSHSRRSIVGTSDHVSPVTGYDSSVGYRDAVILLRRGPEPLSHRVLLLTLAFFRFKEAQQSLSRAGSSSRSRHAVIHAGILLSCRRAFTVSLPLRSVTRLFCLPSTVIAYRSSGIEAQQPLFRADSSVRSQRLGHCRRCRLLDDYALPVTGHDSPVTGFWFSTSESPAVTCLELGSSGGQSVAVLTVRSGTFGPAARQLVCLSHYYVFSCSLSPIGCVETSLEASLFDDGG